MTPEAAKRVRAMALGYRQRELTDERNIIVQLPNKPVKKPKKWVLLAGVTICPNGSIVRFPRGHIVDQAWLYNELLEAGARLEPVG